MCNHQILRYVLWYVVILPHAQRRTLYWYRLDAPRTPRMKKPLRKLNGRSAKPRQGTVSQGRRPRSSRGPSVIYEDDAVVVLDKPAGLAAVPVKGADTPSALSLLSASLKPRRQRALVVHRIDRFTSGALLFAKTEADRDILVRQFLSHTPVRQYLAVLRGHLPAREGTLVHYLRRVGMHQQLSTERDGGAARAELRYSVERLLRNASLVRVSLVTGLQNQIRAQFSAEGHAVVGDRKYHPEEAQERRIDRVALHAAHLEFVHPRSGETVAIDCDLPPDIRSLIQGLSPRDARR
jgi:23S rRNA pseudouridine1911/1915/1917 synthase